MKAVVRAEKGETEDDDSLLDEPSKFINPIDYVIQTWFERKLHHIYPEPGGYNDQSDSLMKDWQTLGLYYLRAQKNIFSAPPTPNNPQEWLNYMGD
jgi:hypothetical protein